MAEKKTPEAEAPRKKTMTMVIAGAVALILLVAVGAVGYLLGTRTAPQTLAAPLPEESRAAEAPGLGPLVDIESFVINILEEEQTRYLKAALTIEVDSEGTADRLQSRMPQVRDAILLLIGNKTFDEVRDLQGKLQLRAELVDRLNNLLPNGEVRKIYFTDFVVQ